MYIHLVKKIKITQAFLSASFTRLWIGQATSSLGDGAFSIALSWEILLLTRSGVTLGIVMIAQTIPKLLFILFGGVAADRLPRKMVLLYTDAVRTGVLIIITFLGYMHLLQLWHLIVLSAVFGTAQSFFYPAYQGLIPQIVSKNQLSSANALNRLSAQMSGLLGPLIGVWCVLLAGPLLAFAFDAMTFAVSVLSLAWLQVPPEQEVDIHTDSRPNRQFYPVSRGRFKSQKIVLLKVDSDYPSNKKLKRSLSSEKKFKQVLSDIQEGFTYIRGSTWLWVSILVAAITNIGIQGPTYVSLPKLVHDTYHTGIWLLGALETAYAIGSIAAVLLVGQLHLTKRRGLLAYLALMGAIGGLILLGLPWWSSIAPFVSIGAMAILGSGLSFFGIIWATILQELVPKDKLGRVNSVDWLCSFGLTPIAFGIAGALTDNIGPTLTFLLGGLLSAIVVAFAFLMPAIRNLQ